ncbi:SgcJ/EcaC family oxidoreductase [Novosphingobium sp.]|uniref:YybH family protein n=1 Tax=Novosphingobium sp. TaxID=1874826 RepID=UPI0025D7CFFE|nr:SgcJ/EcaC family oxidoreductase [Novosphingobium sp.]
MNNAALILAALALFAAPPVAAKPGPAQVADAVTAMADSAAGWNSGDMDRFMAIYSPSAQTSFVTGKGLLRGKQAIADQYRKGFNFADSAKRGILGFETLDFRSLGPDTALYIARYTLTFPEKPSVSGVTSVVFRREGKAWRIIADHSN